MILSDKHKLIFIHIGKTGGTSIENALAEALQLPIESTYHNDEIINSKHLANPPFNDWVNKPDYDGKINCKHITALQMRDIIGETRFNSYFKFSFVRNPYDRLLSLYSMFTQEKIYSSHIFNSIYASFEDYLEDIIQGHAWVDSDRFVKSICDNEGKNLMDFTGKFETLQEDFDFVCLKMGLGKIELPVTNKTKHRPFKSYFNEHSAKCIYDYFKTDFEEFGYKILL